MPGVVPLFKHSLDPFVIAPQLTNQGDPMLGREGCKCCGVTYPGCAFTCNGDMPATVVVDLPSITTDCTGRFSTGGGSFALDFYGDTSPDSEEALSNGAGGEAGVVSGCLYFGPVIGTECGEDVRPFAAMRTVIFPELDTFSILVGYAVWRPATEDWIYLWAFPSSFPGGPSDWFPDDPVEPCVSMDYSYDYVDDFPLSCPDCGSFGSDGTTTVSSATLRIRAA